MRLKNAHKKAMSGRLLLYCWLVFWPSLTFSAEFPGRYDAPIKAAVEKWWPDLPVWKLLKAQYWQESRLDPAARSPVGAEGIAQFMEPTWRDAIKALGWPHTISRRDAAYAIEGGAWYMRKLRGTWKKRAIADSHDLALASYNAGVGSILKAQALCDAARLWRDISPCLTRITGPANSRETQDYVSKIHRWHGTMQANH
jgi:hypothetical protein